MSRKKAKKMKRLNERRRSERLDIPMQLKYKLLPYKRILQETFAQNVSGGGIGLISNSPLKKGERLKTILYFPTDPKPVIAFSRVVWCKRGLNKGKEVFEIGIQHIKIHYKDRERFVFLFCEMMINYFMLGKRKGMPTYGYSIKEK